MLNQSTPILERTRRTYLSYLVSLLPYLIKKSFIKSESEIPQLDFEKEFDETILMIHLIEVELKKRRKNEDN